jgi:osmotically inducible protein OsmC
MDSKAKAVWAGGLKEGRGSITTSAGQMPYTFATRFEGTRGTNPEELIAAAHSGCYSMALSAELGKVGITPKQIETTATVSLNKDGEGFSVTKSALTTVVSAPGADRAKVESCAQGAKAGCPISKLLKAEITLDLKIEV